MQETRVRSLGWEDPLKKEMATHSSILPEKSHGQRRLVGCSPWGHKESGTTKQLTQHSNNNSVFPGGSIRAVWNGVLPCCSVLISDSSFSTLSSGRGNEQSSDLGTTLSLNSTCSVTLDIMNSMLSRGLITQYMYNT